MKRKCKKNLLFDGGSILSSIGGGGDGSGIISQGINKNIKKFGELAAGAEETAALAKTGRLTGGQQFGSMLADVSGMGSFLKPLILGDTQRNIENDALDRNTIMQRNQMFNFANGGNLNISPSQYAQQMQGRAFSTPPSPMTPVTPQLEPKPLHEDYLNFNLQPTTFLQNSKKNWPIRDQELLNTPGMPDRSRGISLDKVSQGMQAREYNDSVNRYISNLAHHGYRTQAGGDERDMDSILREATEYDLVPNTAKFGEHLNRDFADGGNLNIFKGGFTHNDPDPNNIYNGIPQAQSNDGMQVAERDETRKENFIYSDNEELKITKKMANMFNLPKRSIGKTYADESIAINKEVIDRPNDKITKDTTERRYKALKEANTFARLEKEQKISNNFMKNSGTLSFNVNRPQVNSQLSQQNNITGFDYLNPGATLDYSTVPQMMPKTSTNSPQNYFDINKHLQDATSMGEYNTRLQALVQDPNTFARLGEAGYDLGESSVPWQKNNGVYAGGVGPRELWGTNPQLMKRVFPNKQYGEPLSDEETRQLQQTILSDPELANQVALKPNTQFGLDWLVAMRQKQEGGGDTPGDIPNEDPTVPGIPDTPTGTGDRIKIPPTTKTTEGGIELGVPNLWPEAGLLSALPYMGLQPRLADPTVMSTGYLKPQLVDEMSQRAGIDAANRSIMSGLQGNRASILAQGANYMDATGNAFLQGNADNNPARMATDRFNIQNQTGVAGQNTGILNQFELENKQLINNINAKKADEFANVWSNYVENGSARRANRDLERARRKDIKAFTGYEPASTRASVTIPTGKTTTTTPGFTTDIPQSTLNFNANAALHPSAFVSQKSPYATAGSNMVNNVMEGSRINGNFGYDQNPYQAFDVNNIQNTLNNKKIKRPETFESGGYIKKISRSLK